MAVGRAGAAEESRAASDTASESEGHTSGQTAGGHQASAKCQACLETEGAARGERKVPRLRSGA